MSETPLVSVVMPVRDGAAFLRPALASIAAQTLGAFELVVVDDHSTDATAAILRDHAAADPRIRLLATEAPGIVAALNTGLRAARADLIARMDADDVALPERLERQVAALRSCPRAVVIGTQAAAIDATGEAIGSIAVPTDESAIRDQLRIRSPILHPSVMMRTDAVRRVGLYRPCCTWAEDYDLWLRLAETGAILNMDEALMRLRRHQGQVSRRHRLLQRGAAALARNLAGTRGIGAEHPAALEPSLAAALRAWLGSARAADATLGAADSPILLRAYRRAAGREPRDLAVLWAGFRGLSRAEAVRTAPRLLLGL